jgi:SAM-dependent methyltransferase
MTYLLVPGRHLVNTRFQEAYLFQHVRPPVSHIVVAITSCNQSHSRYNPIPFHIRAIAVDRFMRELAMALGVRYSIIGIPHHRPTPRFAEIVIKEVAEQSGGAIDLAPSRTQVVCSTPPLIERYRALGYEVLTAEAAETAPGQWNMAESLPIEIVQRLGQRPGQLLGQGPGQHPGQRPAGAGALDDPWIRQRIHPASFSTLRDFPEVVHAIQALYDEPLLGDEGSLTETRDYDSYVRAMAGAIDLKYADIRDALVPGRIIDEGCADGALLARIARDFPDSDLIGVDLSAEMLARARERQRAGDFSGCFAFFRQHNLMKPLPLRSPVDTVICNSTLHELYSYAGGADAVRRYLRMKHAQLRMGGRLVARDVVGPSRRTRTVLLWCNPDDGVADHTTATPTDGDTPATLEARLDRLSSAARFRRFALDFLPGVRPAGTGPAGAQAFAWEEAMTPHGPGFRLALQHAMELITKMSYTDNWLSEMHEQFCFWDIDEWRAELAAAGFRVLEGTRAYVNQWRVEHRFTGRVALFDPDGTPLPFPVTNMVLVGEKQ